MSTQDKYNAPFPSNLRTIIDERGTTITALARELGITRQAVSLYADGTGQPNADKLKRISDYFDVSTDWLLGRSGGVKSLNPDIVAVGEYTGLSESVIEWLHDEDKDNLQILNLLLSNREFRSLIESIFELKSLIDKSSIEFQELENNLHSDGPDSMDEKIVSQYTELAQQIGGLHIIDDYEYFHMKEYFINKKISEIIESLLYCDSDENVKTLKELIFDI